MNVEKYLQRLDLRRSEVGHDVQSLARLQRLHLLNIPFENLDIHWKRTIELDERKFFDKIIGEHRGGFCYELNGLFAALLNALGFKTRLVSARVCGPGGKLGPEFDHLAIIVTIDGEDYLSDVGFGDFTAAPLKLSFGVEQLDPNGIFVVKPTESEYLEVVNETNDGWDSCYIFKPDARRLSDFSEMCVFHQTSPDSHFTSGKLCSQMVADGRKTLTDKKFVVSSNGSKIDYEISSEEEFILVLAREFGIRPIPVCG